MTTPLTGREKPRQPKRRTGLTPTEIANHDCKTAQCGQTCYLELAIMTNDQLAVAAYNAIDRDDIPQAIRHITNLRASDPARAEAIDESMQITLRIRNGMTTADAIIDTLRP